MVVCVCVCVFVGGVCVCAVTLSNLVLPKCQSCFDLDFKGVGNKMTIDNGISCEK